jgi:hypothetical protein
MMLRPGGITSEQLEAVVGVGKVHLDPALALKTAPTTSTSTAASSAASSSSSSSSSSSAAKAVGAASSHSLLDDGDPSTASLAPKAPGMKYLHYAPRAPLRLVVGSDSFMQGLIDAYRAAGRKVGVLTTEEKAPAPTTISASSSSSSSSSSAADSKAAPRFVFTGDVVLSCGVRSDLGSVARRLYDVLRAFDETEVDLILSETFPATGLGLALMNRLQKAAAKNYLYQPSNSAFASAGTQELRAAVTATMASAPPLPKVAPAAAWPAAAADLEQQAKLSK